MRVLITGAAGFLGAHIVEHLLVNTDWDIVCLDSFHHKGVAERIADSTYYQANKDRVSVVTHDLTAPLSRMAMTKIGRVDYIINAASQSHVDRSIDDPVPFAQNNMNLMLNMLQYARLAHPSVFIQISTDEVYGPAPDGTKHKEWASILPSNPYSGSKAAQEAMCIAYWRTYGVPVVITNTMNLIGERQDPEKFVPMVMKKVLAGEEMVIHGTPDNIGSRFYIHCRNQADGLLFILKNLKPAKYPDTDRPDRYNIVGEKEMNNLEMAELIAKLLDKPLKYRFEDFHKTRPGHDRRYALDGKKLADLGWQPPIDLETSLKRTVDWTLENREWLDV